ncbi:hypothetical protein MOV66_01000 [Agrobacterium sp. SHOUNA12C]|nr:hypothetical protein [Agrobacterium sp. BETTINA12B]MCJ9755211.1 hypothetical protein [Agrobacterium sp. SHOUNA12C]
MSNQIEAWLENDGPCLSTVLTQRLMEQGVSAEAARQRVSRGGKKVRRLSGLVFPKNARFLYHDSDYKKERYWRALLRDIGKASPAYGPAIGAILSRGGVVPLAHFDIVSGSPILQKGQVASSTVLARLEAVKFLTRIQVDGVGECIAIDANGHFGLPDTGNMRARLITENVLLCAVGDWARRLGIASFDKIELRGEGALPRYGTFNWDLCGPSYLRHLLRRNDAGAVIPGFLVCDAIAGGEVDELAMAAFVRKCKLSAGLPKMPNMFPVSIADRYTREAQRLGKANGIVMATPRTLFGTEVAIGLATLLTTLSKAAAVAVSKPEVIEELFNRLGGIEGAAKNLRGALFEMIVGHAVQAIGGGSIDIGKRLHVASGQEVFKAELDVLRVLGNKVTVYECKGYQPSQTVTLGEVEAWITEKVPGIYKWLKADQFHNHQIHFEFWTSGNFSPEAQLLLEKASAATRKYGVSFKDGPAVRKYVADLPTPGLIKVLDEHYFNHPLARFDRRYDGSTRLAELELELDPRPSVNGFAMGSTGLEDIPL